MTRYFLDPKNRRGELKKPETLEFWIGSKAGYSGCQIATELTGKPWNGWRRRDGMRVAPAWSARFQWQQTALLPWEV